MGIVKSHQFWIGLAVGTIAGTWALNRVAPGIAKKIPQ